jgi:hypothetical protein
MYCGYRCVNGNIIESCQVGKQVLAVIMSGILGAQDSHAQLHVCVGCLCMLIRLLKACPRNRASEWDWVVPRINAHGLPSHRAV